MSGFVEGAVLVLLLAGAPDAAGNREGEMWLLPSAEVCEAARADAIASGHAVAGRCLAATIDADAWARAAGQGGAE